MQSVCKFILILCSVWKSLPNSDTLQVHILPSQVTEWRSFVITRYERSNALDTCAVY